MVSTRQRNCKLKIITIMAHNFISFLKYPILPHLVFVFIISPNNSFGNLETELF